MNKRQAERVAVLLEDQGWRMERRAFAQANAGQLDQAAFEALLATAARLDATSAQLFELTY